VDALAADESLDGVVLAVPSIDTVKIVDEAGLIKCTPDRNTLWRAQTPQIFRWQVLMDAYAQPDEVLMPATDDASLVEAGQGRVAVVEGSTENLKITDWVDLQLAEKILAGRRR
jgi:2-C-methyl-D-erythritol 4-phosphate cytidylyltransferase